ncbi:MAG: hypothetical protein ACM3WU_00540 [Bacillota bacterium]
MQGRHRKALRVTLAVLSILTVVAAALVLEGVLHDGSGGRWPWPFGTRKTPPGAATVTYSMRYAGCKDVVSSVTELPQTDLAGVVATLAGTWTVVESADSHVRVERETGGYCPVHEDFRFVALFKGSPTEKPHVCVFRGQKADPAFITRERRDLTEDVLYPQEKKSLQAGILITREASDPPDLDLDEKADALLQGIGEGR